MEQTCEKPLPLSGSDKNSFAFKTIKDRMPTILVKIVDTAHRQRHELAGMHAEDGASDVKNVVGQLSELRYRMTTDKCIQPITTTKHNDLQLWTQAFDHLHKELGADNMKWFACPWLFVECYLYRRIAEILENSKYLGSWDPFSYQKEQAFVGSVCSMGQLAEHVQSIVLNAHQQTLTEQRANLIHLLQVSLWGNKYDLSISAGEQFEHSTASPQSAVDSFAAHVLCNELPAAADHLFEANTRPIHFIMDNVGMELFSDLCLAEYLLSAKITTKVVFHVKEMPWFVSDTTVHDFHWTLEMLRGSQNACLNKLGHKWHERVDQGSFSVVSHPFWTSASPLWQMADSCRDLYDQLRTAHCLIIKGDLNYRKLVGDLAWPSTTPFVKAIGAFRPCALLSLRTMKADVVVGLEQGLAERMQELHADWMLTGDWAVCQFAPNKGD